MAGIGFFAPLPLALMMPFMAGQSLLMGESFGKGFQYGKRKISAMSNEEFNAMDATKLGQEIATDYNQIIPSLEQAVQASTQFQIMIFREMGEILKLIPSEIINFFTSLTTGGSEPIDPALPVNPPPAGFDWTGTIFNLLSSSGIATATANYNTLKGNLENFFAGIFEFNDMVIRDAQKLVDDFVDNILPPAEGEPEPEPPEPEQPTPEQEGTKLTEEFLGTLILKDFATGGLRSRMTAQGLIQWNVIEKITTSLTSFNTSRFSWISQSWTSQEAFGMGSIIEVNAYVNQRKAALGVSFVYSFRPEGKNREEFYLIKDV